MPAFLPEGPPRTLIVPLSGGAARATEAVRRLVDPGEAVVVPLAELANSGRRVLRDLKYEHLAFVGSPATDEIGYGFAPIIALAGRAKHVAVVDVEREEVVSESLLRYVARTAPFAFGQLAASAIAVAAQRVAIPIARRATHLRTGALELTKLVYLRPAVGSTSGMGGSVTHSHEVIRALRTEGVEVEAFTADAEIAKTAALDPVPPCRWGVVRIPRAAKALPASTGAAGDAALIRAAFRAARTADVVYQRHARFSLGGALLARLSGRPLFLEYNGSEVTMGKYWNTTLLNRRLAGCEDAAIAAAACIFVVSDADRRSLLGRGVDSRRIVFNPNGVDADRFDSERGPEIRDRHGIGPDQVVVGFVGTFGPWHGAPVLAQACAELASELPELHLLLVGDGPELEATRSIVRDAGFVTRMTSTGRVHPSEVPDFLDACDILASPHVPLPDEIEFFGSPTKLFEYMAAGKAIVASRLGQIGQVLEDGGTALLVEPGNAGTLADGLRRLARAPELRRELGARARLEATDNHSWQANAQRVIEAYRTLDQDDPV